MHARRLACFILGIWLGGCLLLVFVAAQNRKQVDRILAQASPAARLELKALGPNARQVLLYEAAEQDRTYWKNWTLAQIGIGTLFFLLMLFGSHENAFVLVGILIMVALAALQRFLILPEWAALGRMTDFLPGDQGGPERTRYGLLGTVCYAVEGVKWIAVLVVTSGMVFSRRRSGRSRDSRRELDVVNKSNYRGIDR